MLNAVSVTQEKQKRICCRNRDRSICPPFLQSSSFRPDRFKNTLGFVIVMQNRKAISSVFVQRAIPYRKVCWSVSADSYSNDSESLWHVQSICWNNKVRKLMCTTLSFSGGAAPAAALMREDIKLLGSLRGSCLISPTALTLVRRRHRRLKWTKDACSTTGKGHRH